MAGKYAYAAQEALREIGQPAKIDQIWQVIETTGDFYHENRAPKQALRNEIRKNCEGVDHIKQGDAYLLFCQPRRGFYDLIERRDRERIQKAEEKGPQAFLEPPATKGTPGIMQEVEEKSQPHASERMSPPLLPEELPAADVEYREGAAATVQMKRYERDPRARKACIDHWGKDCVVCGFSFSKKYGPIGDDVITVHHITPLSEIGFDYEVDPIGDLCPVCPNCHAMLHRANPTMTIDDLKKAIEENE